MHKVSGKVFKTTICISGKLYEKLLLSTWGNFYWYQHMKHYWFLFVCVQFCLFWVVFFLFCFFAFFSLKIICLKKLQKIVYHIVPFPKSRTNYYLGSWETLKNPEQLKIGDLQKNRYKMLLSGCKKYILATKTTRWIE